jgi:hypothetical protein
MGKKKRGVCQVQERIAGLSPTPSRKVQEGRFMSHPFEVGKTYRNRAGEYVVEAIDGDRMKIRYVQGGTLVTDVNIQGRIWENIQFEKQLARSEERRRQAEQARASVRKRTSRPKQARTRPSFSGFERDDFEE